MQLDLFDYVEKVVIKPKKDVIDILEGLSETELRLKASYRLGTHQVADMSVEEIRDFLLGE